ncbi:hypothetical protein E7X58_36415, partial [Streptomyces sp. A1499]
MPGGGTPWPAAGGSDADDAPEGDDSLPVTSPGVPAGATPWAGTDTNADAGEDHSVPLPATVFSPPLAGLDGGAPPPGVAPEAKTALMHGGSRLPATAIAPAVDGPNTPGSPQPGAPDTPQPPAGAPAPNAPQPPAGSATPPPGAAAYGYPQGPGVPQPPAGAPAPNAPQPPA